MEELLGLGGKFPPLPLVKGLAGALVPLGAEDLIPQALEVIFVPEEVLIHSPLDPHLQDGGDEDHEDLRLQVLIQVVAGPLHPTLVGLIIFFDVIPVPGEAQYIICLETRASYECEVAALGEPGPLGLCVVFHRYHLTPCIPDEGEIGAIAIVLLPESWIGLEIFLVLGELLRPGDLLIPSLVGIEEEMDAYRVGIGPLPLLGASTSMVFVQ